MTLKIKFALIIFSLFACTYTNAQIEVAHLTTKDYSAVGFGGFLNFSVPVSEGSAVTAEAGFYYFGKDEEHVALVPFLLGYRHTLDRSGTGMYIEPIAGYTIGATDIQKYTETGSPMVDPATGKWMEQKAKGPTAGIGAGYIFPGTFALNIGLRYQRNFVTGDNAMNMLSLRLSHPLSFRRRD